MLPKRSTVWVLLLLAAMCASVLWLFSTAARAQEADPTPLERWLVLPETTVLEQIAVGSCLHQERPQPIWADVIAAKPQLMLMVGDNVYGDIRGDAPTELVAAYSRQAMQPDLARARASFPFLAIWDDHDFGQNDGGGDWRHKAVAARLFHAFWQLKPAPTAGDGIYYSRIYGPPGRRVQIIMLDTRTSRSPLKRKTASFAHWGPYEPDDDAGKAMLGPVQWSWLAAELAKPAEIRLLVSSVQVLSEGHGWERWGNFPGERRRLLELIAKTKAGGTIILSGDRHHGALYRAENGGAVLYELTASSLNMRPPGPSRDARMAPLVSDTFMQENFGLIGINWASRDVVLSLKGIGGAGYVERRIAFAEIGVAP